MHTTNITILATLPLDDVGLIAMLDDDCDFLYPFDAKRFLEVESRQGFFRTSQRIGFEEGKYETCRVTTEQGEIFSSHLYGYYGNDALCTFALSLRFDDALGYPLWALAEDEQTLVVFEESRKEKKAAALELQDSGNDDIINE